VIGTVLWVAVAVAGVALEIAGRFRGARSPGLGRVLARLDTRLPGRLVLLAAWGFVGLHLFARYTLPH
jgi:hypothetical protein